MGSGYTLSVSKTGYITDNGVTLTNVAASSNTIDTNPVVLIRESGSIAGQVLDDHTASVLAGATVTAVDGNSVLQSTTTDASGNFTLTGAFFLSESYTVNFRKPITSIARPVLPSL